jgi:hypothetical protein
MAFFKRPLGLRAAAVAFVASLVVLGLEIPASANSPTSRRSRRPAARQGAWW